MPIYTEAQTLYFFSCGTSVLGTVPSLEEGLAIHAVILMGRKATVKGTQGKGQKEGQGKVEQTGEVKASLLW